jgi:hypothetical protein
LAGELNSLGETVIQKSPNWTEVITTLERLSNEMNDIPEMIQNPIAVHPSKISPDAIMEWQTLVMLSINYCRRALQSLDVIDDANEVSKTEVLTRSILCMFQIIGHRLSHSEEKSLRQMQVKLMRKLQIVGKIEGIVVDDSRIVPDSIKHLFSPDMAGSFGVAPNDLPFLRLELMFGAAEVLESHISSELNEDDYANSSWPDLLLVKLDNYDENKRIVINENQLFRGIPYKLFLVSGKNLNSLERPVVQRIGIGEGETIVWAHVSRDRGIVCKENLDEISPVWLAYKKVK